MATDSNGLEQIFSLEVAHNLTTKKAPFRWTLSLLTRLIKKRPTIETRVPRPLPLKLPPVPTRKLGDITKQALTISLVLISGGIAFTYNYAKEFLYNYAKELLGAIFPSAGAFGIMLVTLAGYACGIYNIRNLNRGAAEPIDGELVLVIGSDVFKHAITRISLNNFSARGDAEVVIPLCVLEKLELEMRAAGPDICAASWMRMLRDQLRLGRVRLQMGSEEAMCRALAAGEKDYFSYEKRIILLAYLLKHLRGDATTVLIVTNSKSLQSKATTRNLKFVRTSELHKLRRG